MFSCPGSGTYSLCRSCRQSARGASFRRARSAPLSSPKAKRARRPRRPRSPWVHRRVFFCIFTAFSPAHTADVPYVNVAARDGRCARKVRSKRTGYRYGLQYLATLREVRPRAAARRFTLSGLSSNRVRVRRRASHRRASHRHACLHRALVLHPPRGRPPRRACARMCALRPPFSNGLPPTRRSRATSDDGARAAGARPLRWSVQWTRCAPA